MPKSGRIRVGIGGWTFAPWRGEFYPEGLPHAGELAYASRHVTTIEINATFYRSQSPATFAKWARETPDGFVFSVKGPRVVTHRRLLAEAGPSIERFLGSGVLELGARLGPIAWQFPPTKKFDAVDFAAFLGLLPRQHQGTELHHVVEVRHPSFATPSFVSLLRRFSIPVVFAEHATYPAIPDVTGDVIYARLQKGRDTIKSGYPPKALDEWAQRAKVWAEGGDPEDLAAIDRTHQPKPHPRDVFIFFIHEGKVRAPDAAMALIEKLGP